MRKLLSLALLAALYFGCPASAQTGSRPEPNRFVSATLIHSATARPQDQTGQTPATEIEFTWSYTPNLPACTTTYIRCYDGFIITLINTDAVIASPYTLDPAALSYDWSPPAGVPYGSLSFAVVTNGYDENGHQITSAPATVTVKNDVTSLAPPTGLQGLTGVPLQ
jgi:hypothetical protein